MGSVRFKPIKLLDIELTLPLPELKDLGDYAAVQALIRLHGMPLGYIYRPVIAGSYSGSDFRKAILAEHSKAILCQLLKDWLSGPGERDRFHLKDLIGGPHPFAHRSLPQVTIGVCTRDRTNHLSLCLAALNRITYPHLDLLVVDNAPSGDGTERLVRDHYPNVRYVREPRPGLNWSRNRAVIEALGEIIAFTDDDAVADSAWVKALAGAFAENPEIDVVTGLVVPYEFETEAQVLFEKRGGFGKGFGRKWYLTDPDSGKPIMNLYGNAAQFGTGANMAFRRTLFGRIGYFDAALDVGTLTNGGGDLEMFFRVLKKGGAILYEPGAIVRHCHRRNHAELRKQMRDWGIGFGSYLMRNAVAYPDERPAFIRLGLWFLWQMNVRRPLFSLRDPLHLPWDLILAEAWGSLRGAPCYFLARSASARIEHSFGPLRGTIRLEPPSFANHKRKYREKIGLFPVDLSQPLPILTDAADFSEARILVTWKGRELGCFDIPACHQPIRVTRLREAIVGHLGLRLLDPEGTKRLEEVRAECDAALACHYLSENNNQ